MESIEWSVSVGKYNLINYRAWPHCVHVSNATSGKYT